jgi:hypothetical protein
MVRGQAAVSTVVFDLGGVLVDWDPRYLYRQLFDDPDEMESFLAEVTNAEWNAHQDAGRYRRSGTLLACVPVCSECGLSSGSRRSRPPNAAGHKPSIDCRESPYLPWRLTAPTGGR